MGTELTKSATARFSVPCSFGLKLGRVTDGELVVRYLNLWNDAITFINGIAPHGYKIVSIKYTPSLKDNVFLVVVNLLVCESDFNHIQQEWNIDSPVDSPNI